MNPYPQFHLLYTHTCSFKNLQLYNHKQNLTFSWQKPKYLYINNTIYVSNNNLYSCNINYIKKCKNSKTSDSGCLSDSYLHLTPDSEQQKWGISATSQLHPATQMIQMIHQTMWLLEVFLKLQEIPVEKKGIENYIYI